MAALSHAPCVTVERVGSVLMIAINRPDVLNAIDEQTAALLALAFDDLDADDSLRVGVLAGGAKAFSSGADLAALRRGQSPVVPGRGFGGLTERPPLKPLIAAVEGYALGGGFEMVLACDLVVAASDAQFGLPEVTRGLIASAGGLLRLPTRVPYQLAMSIALTGDRLSAVDAHRHGLVTELVEPGQARARALALASRIARNAPLAVRASKRLIAEVACPITETMSESQAALQDEVLRSEEAAEGIAAFKERRDPQWSRGTTDELTERSRACRTHPSI